jgi:iron complex transport system substrate-binding protein
VSLPLRLGALLALLLLALPASAEPWPRTVTDSLGRPVTVAGPPRRVVALGGSAGDALRLLRATDLVVGVSQRISSDPPYWGALAALPSVGRWNVPNLEAVAALHPDLVITYGSNPAPGLDERLGKLGIAVLRLGLTRLSTLETELRDLGRALDREAAAEEFLDWHRRVLERVRALADSAGTRPRAYLESPADFKVWGAGSNWHDMALAAGCENVAAAVAASRADVAPEWVAAADPELMVKVLPAHGVYPCPDPGLLPRVRAGVLARPGFARVAAVRRGRVLVLAGEFLGNLGAAVGVAHLAAFAHPGLAGRIDAPGLQRQFLARFLGLDGEACLAFSGEGQ